MSSLSAWSWNSEDNFISTQTTSEFNPTSQYMEFWIIYYNAEGSDSYIPGGNSLVIKYDGEEIGSTQKLSGEDNDEHDNNGNRVYTNTKKTDMNGDVKIEIYKYGKGHSSDGDEKWAKILIYPSNVQYNTSHKIEFCTNWKRNQGKIYYYDNAHTVSVKFPEIKSANTSMTSTAKGKNTFKNKYADTTCDQEITLYKTDRKNSINGVSANWGYASYSSNSNDYYARKSSGGNASNQAVEIEFQASNYNPVCIYPRNRIKGACGYFHDYVQGVYTVHYPRSKGLQVTSDYWNKTITLKWGKEWNTTSSSTLVTDGKWMITRTSGDGNIEYVKHVDYDKDEYTIPGTFGTEYDKEYTYTVSFVPKTWGTNYEGATTDLLSQELSSSKSYTMYRNFAYNGLNISQTGTKLKVAWNCTPIALNKQSEFEVYRIINGGNATMVGTVPTVKNIGEYTFTDDISNLSDKYEYYVKSELLDAMFTSETKEAMLEGYSHITDLTVTKGAYNDNVTLIWNVAQNDETNTYFTVERRVHSNVESAGAQWKLLANMQGQDDQYTYVDTKAQNGIFYDYRVSSYCKTSTKEIRCKEYIDDIGFSSQTGIISGKITFDGGTAVDSVRVVLERIKDSDYDLSAEASLHCHSDFDGLKWTPSSAMFNSAFGKNTYTVQMYLYPGAAEQSASNVIFSVGDSYVKLDGYDAANDEFKLKLVTPQGEKAVSGITIPNKSYSHLTFSVDNGQMTITRIHQENDGLNYTNAIQTATVAAGNLQTNVKGESFRVGEKFEGFIDDVRIFRRIIKQNEIMRDFNHYLSGKEKDLVAYWPFDDGLLGSHQAFDHSFTNGDANNNHANIMAGCELNGIIPNTTELSFSAVTDENGDYIIQGVPYYNGGTNYNVRPVLGIHEFSPATKTCYFSDNSLIFNNNDFTDKSSFPVNGVVYYENTNHPVEDLTVYIDNGAAIIDGQVVTTGKDGTFQVNVPIGNHFIQLKKNNHDLLNEGRWPATGTHNFDREVRDLTFTDQTLVTVAGRIDGGAIEYEKPLGMGASVNNIGQAEIILTSEYNINAAKEVNGLSSIFVPATTPREFESPTSDVNSTAVSGSGTENAVKTITIKTDPATGEFAVKLPPINYEVKSVTIPSNKNLVFEGVQFPVALSATNVDMVYTDSLQEDDGGQWRRFDYKTKYKLAYRTKPVMSFNQKGNPEGVYGEQTYDYLLTEEDGAKPVEKKYNLYAYDEATKKVSYTFNDAPVFFQNERYTFNVMGYEPYVNYDGGKAKEFKVPLDNVSVTVSNEMSIENYLKYDTGELVKVVDGEFKLDSLGKGTYMFIAGFPRTQTPYTLGLSMSFKAADVNYSWEAPGFADGKFKGIILGQRPYGNNFVTAGTDKLLMVLRDPPGSRSHLSWTTTSTHKETTTITKVHVINEHHTIAHGIRKETKISIGTVAPPGLFTGTIETANKSYLGATDVINGVQTFQSANTKESTYTLSTKISTSDNPMYDGPDADIYVGLSRNYLYGMAKCVRLTYMPDGTMSLGDEDILTEGDSIKTAFAYTQYYIINTLIPNYKMMRNRLILPQGSSVTNKEKYYKYVSDVPEDDPNFGKKGYYHTVGGIVEKDKALVDSVSWCNSQIAIWEKNISDNEKAKVKAIDNREDYLIENYSLSSGAKYDLSESESSSESDFDSSNFTESMDITVDWEWAPFGFALTENFGAKYENQYIKSSTIADSKTTAFDYTLNDGDPEDALTIDVLKAPDGFSPIFYTRAGQTSGNWEPDRKTLYYEPGKHEIMAQTMKNMVPKIYQVSDNVLTNVPSTGSAIVKVTLANESETNVGGLFKLCETKSTEGCTITCNGVPLASGITYYLGGQYGTKDVTVEIKSVDKSALDCDLGLVLVDMTQADPLGPYPINAFEFPIKVSFVPGSSEINILADKAILNSEGGGKVNVTLKDYDLNLQNLMNISLEYRGESDANWKTYQAWSCNKADKSSETVLDKSSVTVAMDMSDKKTFPDQMYSFRARTMSDFGGEKVYNYSQILYMLKDVETPKIQGYPSPSNGTYKYNTEVYAAFNEDIRHELITKADNVSLIGQLNDGKISHEVSLACNGNETIATEAKVALPSNSVSFNTWVRWNGEGGSILAHGTSNNNFSFGVLGNEEDNKFYVKIGENVYKSSLQLPKDEWIFLSVVVDGSNADSKKVLCDYASANTPQPVALIAETMIGELNFAPAKVTLGYGFRGNIHDLSIWDNARSFAVANSQKDKRLSKFSSHLVAYWPLNNGHGTVANEVVKEANIVLDSGNSWNIENINYSARINKGERIKIVPSANANTTDDDDYLMQLWFRVDKTTGTVVAADKYGAVFTIGDEINTSLIINNQTGELFVKGIDGTTAPVGSIDIRDEKWHHFSMMVHKATNANATFFLDGKNSGHLASSQVNNISGPIYLGSHFAGYIDEVRVAEGMFSEKAIEESMYVRYSTDNSNMLIYYPFEVTEADEYGQPVTHFSATDYGTYAKDEIHMKAAYEDRYGEEIASSDAIAPPLLNTPIMQEVKYDLIVSDRRVTLAITESPERIEGCNLVASLRNIQDEAGNVMAPVTWTFNVEHQFIEWKEKDMAEMVYVAGDEWSFDKITKHIRNNTGFEKEWSLEGLPYWMEASQTGGTLKPNEELALSFNLLTTIGSSMHTGNIYLVETATGISHPLSYELINSYQIPRWDLDPKLYKNTMTIIGQVAKDGTKQESPYSMVGAFNSNNECVGYATATYEPRYDAYYYYLTVYGNEESSEPLRFVFYDSQSGITYPDIDVLGDNGTTDKRTISFSPNKMYGSLANPLIWQPNDKIEQTIDVKEGWNWISFNTLGETPLETLFSEMTGTHYNDIICREIVNEESFSVYNETDMVWEGTITSVHPGTMYKVNYVDYNEIVRRGLPANAAQLVHVIQPGWNWFGATVNSTMSLSAALADMNPAEGDLIKNFDSMSYFTNGGWVGPLKSIDPGKGYYYYSADGQAKNFVYPTAKSFGTATQAKAVMMDMPTEAKATMAPSAIAIEDYPAKRKYTGTMTMIASIQSRGAAIGNAQLQAYDSEGEMRGVNITQDKDDRHLIYIVLHGDEAASLTFNAVVGEGAAAKTYTFNSTVAFEDGKNLGTTAAPLVFNLDDVTAINGVAEDPAIVLGEDPAIVPEASASGSTYDLAGRKVLNTKAKGIYIQNRVKIQK